MHNDYHSPLLRNLRDQQVRFAPHTQRVVQATNAEVLIHEIAPERTYTYDYLCFRLTDYRPDSFPHSKISGEDALHDLRLLVEDLTDSANLRADDFDEPVYTVEDLSKKFKVSTKTISRWRQQGLVGRRLLFDGRKRVGFPKSTVDRFVEHNKDKVERGSHFSQLTGQQREEIIERARRMAHAGGCPSEVSRRIARRTGRSVETIRYTLRQFDKQHPSLAVFPHATGPLTEEVKTAIYQEYRRGSPVESLAKRYCRTKTTVYRVINETRAARMM